MVSLGTIVAWFVIMEITNLNGTNNSMAIANFIAKSPAAHVTHGSPDPIKAMEKNNTVSIADDSEEEIKGACHHVF